MSCSLNLQKYLKTPSINERRAKLLFKARTNTLPVKANWSSTENRILQEDLLFCEACLKEEEDNQTHLFLCQTLVMEVPELRMSEVEYSDIYSKDIDKISKVSIILEKIMKARSKYYVNQT